jgi:hypothetical protein
VKRIYSALPTQSFGVKLQDLMLGTSAGGILLLWPVEWARLSTIAEGYMHKGMPKRHLFRLFKMAENVELG